MPADKARNAADISREMGAAALRMAAPVPQRLWPLPLHSFWGAPISLGLHLLVMPFLEVHAEEVLVFDPTFLEPVRII